MNLPKFPHSAMFVGVTACGKTEFLLQLLETIYKSHFEFIVILCPTILDNKTYLSRKWIFDDKNVFIVCDIEGKLNEWIKLFKNVLKGHQTLFIIDDCSAESEINKKRENDVIPDKSERDRLKKCLQDRPYSKLILKCHQPTGYHLL